jgi:hypothetical protein
VRTRWDVLLVALAVSLALTGCDARLRAPRLVFDVTSGAVVLDSASAGRIPTGETLVTVRNDTDADLRVLLLRNPPPLRQLPDSVLKAVDTIHNANLLAVTPTLSKRKNELSSGGLGYQIHSTGFHVFFRRGSTYAVVVVDPAGQLLGRSVIAGSGA